MSRKPVATKPAKLALLTGGFTAEFDKDALEMLVQLNIWHEKNPDALHAAVMTHLTRQRAFELIPEIRQITSCNCASWLMGRRCFGYKCKYCIPGGDHTRQVLTGVAPYRQMWIRPYRWSFTMLSNFMKFVEKLELGVNITGDPVYYPGKAFLVVLTGGRIEWESTTKHFDVGWNCLEDSTVPPLVDYPVVK